MTYYIEDPYFDLDIEEFNECYEIEGVRKIKELSRQLRTFFNYKAKVIRFRFRSNLFPTENVTNAKFFTQKQIIESTSLKFIALLKTIKKNSHTLEQGIRSLYFEDDRTQINDLLEIIEKLFILIHNFSEENIHNHPKFLKFIVILTQNICLVKKCLYAQFSEFYEELEINYMNLEEELEGLIEKTPIEKEHSKKQLEERLTS